jgi:hypothetical protein
MAVRKVVLMTDVGRPEVSLSAPIAVNIGPEYLHDSKAPGRDVSNLSTVNPAGEFPPKGMEDLRLA